MPVFSHFPTKAPSPLARTWKTLVKRVTFNEGESNVDNYSISQSNENSPHHSGMKSIFRSWIPSATMDSKRVYLLVSIWRKDANKIQKGNLYKCTSCFRLSNAFSTSHGCVQSSPSAQQKGGCILSPTALLDVMHLGLQTILGKRNNVSKF